MMRRLFIFVIKLYKIVVSPLLPPACRFLPTCSDYAIEAIKKHGTLKGMYFALRRVLRCHPLCEGGFDPVP